MLTVYKEKGYTSSDAVARLRGILRMRKIGHTGTLDPDAEGVLPMCLGNATRICEELSISRNTVKYHARNIYDKLGVHSQQEVIDLVSDQPQTR